MHTKFRVTYIFMAWQKKSLGGIKYNSTALALHILELYNTEGSITMYFPFFSFFFLLSLALALSGLFNFPSSLAFLKQNHGTL